MKYNLGGYFNVISGVYLIILSSYLMIPFYPRIFVVIGGFLVIDGIFKFKGYINKTYFLVLFIVIALFGVYALSSASNNILYYYNIGAFIFSLIIFSWYYLQRNKRRDPIYKNEW